MRAAKKLRLPVIVILAACLIAAVAAVWFPPDPLYLCQKVLDGGLEQWKLEAKTNVWPNVGGDSAKSFAEIERYLGPPDDHAYSLAYGYVPGLKDDDPPDLVFMYLRRMTRRTWNGDHSATIFARKKWMVIGPRFFGSQYPEESLPEGGDVVDTAELKRRFQRTFDFLKAERRPYAETIIAEHRPFVHALDDRK